MNVKTEELNKEIKFDSYKILYAFISDYLICIIIVYFNILIFKALINKMIININVF